MLLLVLTLLFAQPEMVDVALDPGHSYADVGAAAPGLREYQLTLDLAQRVRGRLEAKGVSVRLTREDNGPLSAMVGDLTERTRIEQEARISAAMPARIYVSLHFNGGPPGMRGTETYVNYDRGPDAHLDAALASSLQSSILRTLEEHTGYASMDRGVRSDLLAGKPYGHFFSLRGPAPSALVELLFLSSPADAAVLRDDATLDALASGCAQGILEYLASVDSVGVGAAPD